ncbi:MAG: hypothetical protein JSW39_15160 [Desulfobacterales bacterium]|nr:MAG: hypothetical protein JSW39_15160 [Desulfobacterales bacterium]
MNIVDSTGWLAYFADEPNAKHFLAPLNDKDALAVPALMIPVLRYTSHRLVTSALARQEGSRGNQKTDRR